MTKADRPTPGLLVSVRSAAEAAAALAGGADLIDVKEPSRGALGRADDAVIRAVVAVVGGRRPVSAALGDLDEQPQPPNGDGLAFVKWGLAGAIRQDNWRGRLTTAIRQLPASCRAVAVAYADGQRAEAPEPETVAAFAAESGCAAFLLDTWHKDGTTLRDWLADRRIEALVRFCRAARVRTALAGALDAEQIAALRDAAPDWFAVRGAACRGGRGGTVDIERVQRLVSLLR